MESKIICQGTEISRTWNASLPIPWPRAEDPNKRATVTMSRVTFGHLAHLHILCTYRILGWLVQFCIFKSFQIQPIPASLCLEDMEGYGHVLQKDYKWHGCVFQHSRRFSEPGLTECAWPAIRKPRSRCKCNKSDLWLWSTLSQNPNRKTLTVDILK